MPPGPCTGWLTFSQKNHQTVQSDNLSFRPHRLSTPPQGKRFSITRHHDLITISPSRPPQVSNKMAFFPFLALCTPYNPLPRSIIWRVLSSLSLLAPRGRGPSPADPLPSPDSSAWVAGNSAAWRWLDHIGIHQPTALSTLSPPVICPLQHTKFISGGCCCCCFFDWLLLTSALCPARYSATHLHIRMLLTSSCAYLLIPDLNPD